MRVDKFLNSVCITKRRAVAEDMCRSGVVFVGDSVAKASKDIRVGDILSIKFTSHTDKYKILAIPTTKNVPKNEQSRYVEKLQSADNAASNEKNSPSSQSENDKKNSPSQLSRGENNKVNSLLLLSQGENNELNSPSRDKNNELNSQSLQVGNNEKNSPSSLGDLSRQNLNSVGNFAKNGKVENRFKIANANFRSNSKSDCVARNDGDFSKKREFILAENELNSLCEALPECGIILLCGDLASGKTTLVQHLARARGVKDAVNSPTFSLMQSYETPQSAIFHYDIYNDGFAGLVQRGLAENLFENGLHLIEWGDENLELWLKKMSLNYLKISIFMLKNKRKYEILEFKNDE